MMMRAAGAHPRAQGPTQSLPQPPGVHRGIDCALKHRPQRHGAPSSQCRASPYRAGGGGLVDVGWRPLRCHWAVRHCEGSTPDRNEQKPPPSFGAGPPPGPFCGPFPFRMPEGSSRDCGKGAGGAEVFGDGLGDHDPAYISHLTIFPNLHRLVHNTGGQTGRSRSISPSFFVCGLDPFTLHTSIGSPRAPPG